MNTLLKKGYIIMKIKLGLIEGRHQINDVNDYIFKDAIVDVKDFEFFQEVISEKLEGVSHLDLYVTGLTVVLVEVINFCKNNNIDLCLYHFDRDTGGYFKQPIV